ncbi:MAG: sodium:solute symporter, partial [Candidatus Latescibacteria bacterium]|nr:sodium:solute symporter [Candidatus Latescibacterota bacterium]
MKLAIHPIDLIVIVVYLIGIVTIGCWAGLRRQRATGGKGYFLAGRSLSWSVIGLSLFSTNISTIHLVSLAQEGYVNGLAYGNFEWMAAFTLIALSLFFAPFYIRSNV